MIFPVPEGNRRLSIAVIILALLILQACTYNELPTDQRTRPAGEPTVEPVEPLPPNPCSGNLVEGYCSKVSYTPGEEMQVFLQSKSSIGLCKLDIYGQDGKIAFSVKAFLTVQAPTSAKAHSEGYNYSVSATFKVPELVSGIYFIENRVPFIIKSRRPVDVMIVYASNTANAYCEAGGKSLYSKTDRPYEVSFLRPISLEPFSLLCLKWFSTLKDIDVGYIADVDMDDYSNLYATKVLTIVGHSEYWTRIGRQNFDKFVQRGGHALILSGNTMWWQVRYSSDKTRMICYKSLVDDPIADMLSRTTLWTDPILNYSTLSSVGADFTHGGYGTRSDNGWNGYKIVNARSPLLEGLNLKKGDVVSLPTVEFDGTPISKFDDDGFPVVVKDSLNCNKIELIGFDKGFRLRETYGTFFIYKPTATSGYIINTCSTDWCSSDGMGGVSGDAIKQITRNAVTKLVNNETVFSR
jgi:hypothetical protein